MVPSFSFLYFLGHIILLWVVLAEMAETAKCAPCKQENLSSDPNPHKESQV